MSGGRKETKPDGFNTQYIFNIRKSKFNDLFRIKARIDAGGFDVVIE
jgi:hypothetical protein